MSDGKKKRYAIMGDPVSHSLSPAMHNAAFAELGIDAEYEAVEVKAEEIDGFIKTVRSDFAGLNVTVPHKCSVMKHLDWVDDYAARLGSVNTIVNNDSTLIGFSTDGYGLEKALEEELSFTPQGKTILFLGAGGAARAAAFHLISSGAAAILLANRTFERAEKLASDILSVFPDASVKAIPSAETALLEEAANSADILIQSTSLGLKKDDPSPFPKEFLRPDLPVFDMIYGATTLLADAEDAGAPNANGTGMLVHQGAHSFYLWTNREAPVETMRRVVEEKLRERGVAT